MLENGDAFISCRKADKLLGVGNDKCRLFVLKRHPNYNTSNGLDDKMLTLAATHFALFSRAANDTARQFASKLMQAGAKAYLYHEAGFVLNAVNVDSQPKLPETFSEALFLAGKLQAKNEMLTTQNRQLEVDKSIVEDRNQVLQDQVKNDYPRVVVTNNNYYGNFRP